MKLVILNTKFSVENGQILVLKQSLVYYASQHSCNEELSWMVDCRMENHGVNDNNFNIINL